jgi:hypothetical protein
MDDFNPKLVAKPMKENVSFVSTDDLSCLVYGVVLIFMQQTDKCTYLLKVTYKR